jgi:hypothetical protein
MILSLSAFAAEKADFAAAIFAFDTTISPIRRRQLHFFFFRVSHSSLLSQLSYAIEAYAAPSFIFMLPSYF